MGIHVVPFIAVAGVIVVTPGVDMALVTRNALRGGRGAALATALGVNLGIAVWVLAAAVGLAAAVQASQTLFDAVRFAGAAYLVALGIRSLLNSRSSTPDQGAEDGRTSVPRGAALRQGLASNLLNPKMAVLFTSLLPQFIERNAGALPGLLVLGALFNVLGLLWLTAFALTVARTRAALAKPRVRRCHERITGSVLIALGLRVAIERR